jgi:S-adenosylmethionine:tRNA ribosyltransferase-isomerase
MLEGAGDPSSYLVAHGQPIRYTPGRRWPMSDYQTLFAAEPGSAEMPSAGRPFTTRLVTRLVTAGVAVLPIVLHAGVSSYEEGEAPGAERFRVPEPTARLANAARAGGGRLVAVGTTVVRALESVVDAAGTLHPDEGVTDLVITPERGVRAVDALVTGWHEPRSSHLRMLEAIAGRALLERSYAEAVDHGYLWHEFGDSLLVGDGFNEGSAAGQA